MSKIICDICGTSYEEEERCCPICGYAQNLDEAFDDDLIQDEDELEEVVEEVQTAAAKKEIFDYDEVNDDEEEDEDDDEDDDDDRGPNVFLVIFLTILIVALLAAAGFVYMKWFAGDKKAEAPAQTTQPAIVETTAAPTTEATIPCEILTLSSSSVAELSEVGQNFLLHVRAMPEDTTDVILYTSGDESVATVTDDGKITAVGEGETTVYISCGKSSLECKVVVKYVEDTVPPVTIATEPEAIEATETTEATSEPVETTAPSTASDVKLKLKKTDIQLKVYYQFTLVLDCELQQNAVQWTSEHPHIATVDENGMVTAVKTGTTEITARYGGQEVSCMVRCIP